MRKPSLSLAVAIAASTAGLVPLAQAASAASPRGCPTTNEYSFTGIIAGDFNGSGYHATNGPGGTVTDSVSAGDSFSTTRTKTTGASLSDSIAAFTLGFHQDTGKSVQATYTATSLESGGHAISAGYMGTETWGQYGYYNNWTYGHDTATCGSYVVVSAGNSIVDYPADGFHYTQVPGS